MRRADQRQFHYIYKITRDDGRYYIGMHSCDNVDDGYFGSGKLITRSIKKHGLKSHTKAILEFHPTRDALKLREKELVNEECLGDKLCMNLKLGGDGGWDYVNSSLTPEDLTKRGRSWRGKSTGNAGVKRTEDWNKNISLSLLGKTPAMGMLGKKHSSQTKSRMSDSGSGENNSQFGTCWVTNGNSSIKIKLESLEEYIAGGYVRGRKVVNR